MKDIVETNISRAMAGAKNYDDVIGKTDYDLPWHFAKWIWKFAKLENRVIGVLGIAIDITQHTL